MIYLSCEHDTCDNCANGICLNNPLNWSWLLCNRFMLVLPLPTPSIGIRASFLLWLFGFKFREIHVCMRFYFRSMFLFLVVIILCMMNLRTIETNNSNILNARDVRFVGAWAETNRATCNRCRVVKWVGAREVIRRRHADEGGLVHAAGETTGSGEPQEDAAEQWEQQSDRLAIVRTLITK